MCVWDAEENLSSVNINNEIAQQQKHRCAAWGAIYRCSCCLSCFVPRHIADTRVCEALILVSQRFE